MQGRPYIRLGRIGRFAAFAAALATAVWVSVGSAHPDSPRSLGLDPTSAVTLFALLHLPRPRWPSRLAAAIIIEILARLGLGFGPPEAILEALESATVAVLAGQLLVAQGVGRRVSSTLPGVVRFAAALVLSSVVAVALVRGVGNLIGVSSAPLVMINEALRSALGGATALPFMLAWRRFPTISPLRPVRILESMGLTCLFLVFAALAADEGSTGHGEVFMLLVPLFVWTASRFGLSWATLGNLAFVLLLSELAVVAPTSTAWATSEQAFVFLIVIASLCLAVVIEDRERALRQSAKAQSRLTALLASVPDLVLRLDASGQVVERLGTEPFSPAPSPALSDLLPPPVTEEVLTAASAVLADGTPRSYRCKSEFEGRERWLEARVARVPPSAPTEGASALVTIRDVSDDHRGQQQAAEMEKARALRQLTGGVAHDFNNLLTTIIGNLDLLKMEATDPDQLASLEDVSRAADRGRELTHHLLAYSERQPLQAELLSVERFMQAARSELGPGSKGVTVDVELPPAGENWTVCADPGRLRTALANLVQNAMDASPPAGRVVVRLERRNVTEEAHESARSFARILVEDDGEGMSEQTLERACDPFFTTRGVARSGLGLSMVRGFARQSGGHLQLRSRHGWGTRASLLLPLIETEDPIENGLLPRSTVLVAERNPEIRRLVARHTSRLGYVPVEVGSSREAQQILERIGPVALVVIQPDLAEAVESVQLGAQAVLYIYGDGTPCSARPALRKPFEPGALHRELRRLLPVRVPTPAPMLEDSWPVSSPAPGV